MSEIHEGVGSVYYPGIKQIVSASYSRSHGITPDICQIQMAPQTLDPSDPDYTPIEPDGYLLFQFEAQSVEVNSLGNRSTKTTQILIQGCRPDRANIRRSGSSEIWTIPVFDRRWKWKFGSFSGHWNMKKNGVIEIRKERTVRQLAEMCLEAMGEKKYNTKALDQLEDNKKLKYRKKIRPEVHWDRIPPAQALNDLVTSLGFRVCLKWDDTVSIEKYGEGALLSTDDLLSGGFEADLPEVSNSVTVVGGITMHETIWSLEAVGLDIDGMWRPVYHLSYVPKNKDTKQPDWRLTEPGVFDGILASYQDIEDQKADGVPVDKDEYRKKKEQYSLAQQTVYRSFRLSYPLGTKEDEFLRKKYDKIGVELAEKVNEGLRPGDKKYDDLLIKYEEARRELFLKSEPVIPGPQKKDPRTGKLGDYRLEEFEQVLPCFKTRAELTVDSYTGKLIRKPAEMAGFYYNTNKVSNTDDPSNPIQSVDGDKFEIVPDLGIIQFSEPMYRMIPTVIKVGKKKSDKESLPYFAELYIQLATPLKNTVGEPARFEYREELDKKYRTTPAKLPGNLKDQPRKVPIGTDTKLIVKNEIVQAYQARYTIKDRNGVPTYSFVEVVDNVKTEELEKQALAVIDVENLRIITKGSGSGVYAGLKKINLDGAIHQVTISRNTTGGMTTTVSRNSEVNPVVPSFDERQRRNALKEMIKERGQKIDKTQQVNPEA